MAESRLNSPLGSLQRSPLQLSAHCWRHRRPLCPAGATPPTPLQPTAPPWPRIFISVPAHRPPTTLHPFQSLNAAYPSLPPSAFLFLECHFPSFPAHPTRVARERCCLSGACQQSPPSLHPHAPSHHRHSPATPQPLQAAFSSRDDGDTPALAPPCLFTLGCHIAYHLSAVPCAPHTHASPRLPEITACN